MENRPLGMVNTGGKATASHSVPPPIHPLRDFFPIPIAFVCDLEYIVRSSERRVQNAYGMDATASTNIKEYQHVSLHI